MPDRRDLDGRLRAVEQALTDGEHDLAEIRDAAVVTDRLDALEDRMTTLEERSAELDAAVQAIRGYVGNVRSVNADVEERADAALAAVDRLENRVTEGARNAQFDGERGRGEQRDPSSAMSDGPAGRENPTGTADGSSVGGSSSVCGSHTATAGGHRARWPIEMPPPGASTPTQTEDADESKDRSVIERVREAL